MATLTVSSGSYIRPYRLFRIRHFRVNINQVIKLGDPVVLSVTADQGDRIALAGADPAVDRGFVGFAAEAMTTGATVTADNKIPVWLATQDSEFLVHVANGQALDADDISLEYGIVYDATNLIWRLDKTETTAKIFRVLELKDLHGDVNGRLIVAPIAPERLYGD
jgi:hypothetical protein